jgi:hypothetical protein
MPFQLAAVRAGLELRLDTSPPVLRRIAGFKKAAAPGETFDLIRAYLRLLGPATPRHVADYLDAPLKDVKARWPDDVVGVTVGGEARGLLAAGNPRSGRRPRQTVMAGARSPRRRPRRR